MLKAPEWSLHSYTQRWLAFLDQDIPKSGVATLGKNLPFYRLTEVIKTSLVQPHTRKQTLETFWRLGAIGIEGDATPKKTEAV